MKDEVKLSGQLKVLMHWPWILAGIWCVMAVFMFMFNIKAGFLTLLFFTIYLIAAAVIYTKSKKNLFQELISFAAGYGQIQKELLEDFHLPYAILDYDGKFLWMNQKFMEVFKNG